MISVVIPAHNEASVISRLLAGLLADAHPDELDVVVVANGCSDETAKIAATFGESVSVVSTPIASKSHALQLGDEYAQGFPRMYVDADVELRTADVRALAEALSEPGILASAPERLIPMDGPSLPVRWYYDIWQRLPTVREGLYGRGVIGVSEEGHRRLAVLPQVMNDDLAAGLAFTPAERRIVGAARVIVHPPRTTADLLRRRIRGLTGNAQLRGLMSGVEAARTTRSDLIRVVRAAPTTVPRMAVFLGITAVARWRARRPIRDQDFTTWLRDDSSRATMAEENR